MQLQYCNTEVRINLTVCKSGSTSVAFCEHTDQVFPNEHLYTAWLFLTAQQANTIWYSTSHRLCISHTIVFAYCINWLRNMIAFGINVLEHLIRCHVGKDFGREQSKVPFLISHYHRLQQPSHFSLSHLLSPPPTSNHSSTYPPPPPPLPPTTTRNGSHGQLQVFRAVTSPT